MINEININMSVLTATTLLGFKALECCKFERSPSSFDEQNFRSKSNAIISHENKYKNKRLAEVFLFIYANKSIKYLSFVYPLTRS